MTEKEKDIHLFILEEERRKNRERVLQEQIEAKDASDYGLISPQDLFNAKETLRKGTTANDQSDDFALNDLRPYLGLAESNEIGIESLEPASSFEPNILGRRMRLYLAVPILISFIILVWLSLGLCGLQLALEWATPTNAALQALLWPAIIILGLFQIRMLKAHGSSAAIYGCNDTSHSSQDRKFC